MILIRAETSPRTSRDGSLGRRGHLARRHDLARRGGGARLGHARAWSGPSRCTSTPPRARSRSNGHVVHEGDTVTVSVTDEVGRVILGAAELVPPPAETLDGLRTITGWADEVRTLGVRANADTPADAAQARELGAEGIGLCRTEHMFFGDQRLPAVRRMIMAHERGGAAGRPGPSCCRSSRPTSRASSRSMHGLPVTIRLLDPPLHEFVPDAGDLAEEIARGRAERRPQAEIAELERIAGRVRGAARGEPDAGHARLPAGRRAPGDLRDAGAGDRARRDQGQAAHGRRDHAPAGRLRQRAAAAARR